MKGLKGYRRTALVSGMSACVALGACTTAVHDSVYSGTSGRVSAFDEPPSAPAEGTSCSFVRPAFTALERQLGMHGSVRVSYVVDTLGRIDLAMIEQSSGSEQLDAAARNAVAQGVCQPYVVGGVAHRIVQHTTFHFEGGPAVVAPTPSLAQHGDDMDAFSPPVPARPRASVQAPPLYPPQAQVEAQLEMPQAPQASQAPQIAAPSTSDAVVPPAAPMLTLQQAVREAMWEKLGVAPNSPRAKLLESWFRRFHDDPDVGRYFDHGPNHASYSSLNPVYRAVLVNEAILRVTPEQRSKMFQLISLAFDAAPADCGGVKSTPVVISRNMPWGTMSDADINAEFEILFAMFKQESVRAPMAEVGVQQKMEGRQAIVNTLLRQLQSDPQAVRSVAAAIANGSNVSPAIWCTNMRAFNRALLATPQPQRDWFLVANIEERLEQLRQRYHIDVPVALPDGPNGPDSQGLPAAPRPSRPVREIGVKMRPMT